MPGLPEAAAAEGLEPLEYMKRHGAFLIRENVYESFKSPLPQDVIEKAESVDAAGQVRAGGQIVGVVDEDGVACAGFPTPSRRIEIHASVLTEWKWPELADPGYIQSHVHEDNLDREKNEFALVSTFRLPTLIHTRSANSKWLTELSNTNPVWIHTSDAARLGVRTGDLVRVSTRIGYYVNKAWVTEGIRPGVVACSHHMGRFRQKGGAEPDTNRWQQHDSDMQEVGPGQWRIRRCGQVSAFDSSDPDSRRVWWRDGGVHQNFTFPVQPDPVSGMHCWHQKVTVEKAASDDRYGDTFVDTNLSMQVFEEWRARARPAPGPDGLRRPLHFKRVVRPAEHTFRL